MGTDIGINVAQLPLFSDLPESSLEALLTISKSYSFVKSTNIFSEGSDASGAYLLISGLVKVTRLSIEGDQQLIDVIAAGGLLGEMALYDSHPRSATATAILDSEFLYVSKSSFFKCADEHPAIYRAMLSALSLRLRETNHSFARSQFLPVSGQVAAVLLHLAKCMGTGAVDSSIVIEHPITHRDIASMIGAARENVSRTISQLNKKGIIDTSNSSLTLLDIHHLKSMATI